LIDRVLPPRIDHTTSAESTDQTSRRYP
jgi:hypothetical protein